MTEHPNQAFNETQKSVEQSNLTGSGKLGDAIRMGAAYSILLGCLALGATVASIFWSVSNANLQSELRRDQEELERVRIERDKLKSDYEYRAANPASDHEIPPLDGGVFVKVGVGSTAIFGHELRISVISIEFESNRAKYRVTAIAASGTEEMRIENAIVGYRVTFPTSKNGFSIQLVNVDTFSAGFLLKRLNA